MDVLLIELCLLKQYIKIIILVSLNVTLLGNGYFTDIIKLKQGLTDQGHLPSNMATWAHWTFFTQRECCFTQDYGHTWISQGIEAMTRSQRGMEEILPQSANTEPTCQHLAFELSLRENKFLLLEPSRLQFDFQQPQQNNKDIASDVFQRSCGIDGPYWTLKPQLQARLVFRSSPDKKKFPYIMKFLSPKVTSPNSLKDVYLLTLSMAGTMFLIVLKTKNQAAHTWGGFEANLGGIGKRCYQKKRKMKKCRGVVLSHTTSRRLGQMP